MVWRGGVVLCLCELWVRIICVDGRSRYLYIAHLRCTQCSFMLHLIDICFLPCICLWHVSQIQTCLCVVVGHGFVSTSPVFMTSSSNHSRRIAWPACPKKGKSGPHYWGREVSTQFAQQFVTAVTTPPLVCYVVWSHLFIIIITILYYSDGIYAEYLMHMIMY